MKHILYSLLVIMFAIGCGGDSGSGDSSSGGSSSGGTDGGGDTGGGGESVTLDPIVMPAFSNENKQDVIDNYNTYYKDSEHDGIDVSSVWSGGSASSCTRGTLDNNFQQATLNRINYFRKMVGFDGNISFTADSNDKAQDAAVMMLANGSISHNPPSSWKCYHADKDDTASASNLAFSTIGRAGVDAYMFDDGTGNTQVGHRIAMLSSRIGSMGHGMANQGWGYYDVLMLNKGDASNVSTAQPDFVAWPSAGYFPTPLTTKISKKNNMRWSFSKVGTDFSKATVVMTDKNSITIAPNIIYQDANNWVKKDNAIVWMPNISTYNDGDKFNIYISMNDTADTNYSYWVEIVDP